MASDMASRRLRKELMAIKRTPIDNIVAAPMESNILEWHYVITGTRGSPYEGGHYHGKLKFPAEYPMKPPSVMMLTPNGRFACAKRLCLSMSDFHPESWNPMWSVSTILMGLYSFMLETGATLGSVTSSTAQKKKLAAESLEFNCKNPAFRKLFPELVELQERRKQDAAAAAAAAAAGTAAAAAAAATGVGSDNQNSSRNASSSSKGTGIARGSSAGVATAGRSSTAAAAAAAAAAARSNENKPAGGSRTSSGEIFCWLSVGVAVGVCGVAYVMRESP